MQRKHASFNFFLALITLLLISCQKEEQEFIDETPPETITSSSVLTNLLLRTAQNPGAYDDIVDGNSCTSVNFPVTVTANGQQVTLVSHEDIILIIQIFGQFPNDSDVLEIDFPITVQTFDFSEITLSSQNQLDALALACDTSSQEITCLDFAYPINFLTYNAEQQRTGIVTINEDIELFGFLQNLDANTYVSLDFPVTVFTSGGTVANVSNNVELQNMILECATNNSEAPFDVAQFEEDLTTGIWYVTYFFDDYDETDIYEGYGFAFTEDGMAQAVKDGNTLPGNWSLDSDYSLELFFGENDPLDEFDDDWEIIEANSEMIRLKHTNAGSDSTNYLTFGRDPNTGINTQLNVFIENLITGNWYINLLREGGTDNTSNFNEYQFSFFINGAATAISGNNTINGFWTVISEANELNLIVNFDTATNSDFSLLNDDWDVLEANQNIIRLSDENGNTSETDLLTFGREPNTGGGGPDPQELTSILQSGTWYIDSYLDDGEDETSDFLGFNFTFFNNQSILATNGSQNIDGNYIITIIDEELNFDFNMDSPLNGADDDEYKVIQFTSNTVISITRNSTGEIEDTLIFKKN
ncbi:hypothetical protein [Aequorivita echinoideorum]|uniref:Lipocalin-like domain-containing protein n=1 Tax=Aequorivita echinoideorum TaxID=1549647 RepID=A0ABS5S4U7_9FLAO|nr:hypothetical protein [Aequorivita echinoideorum]MBT0607392.1 hypothetical protein [Aequorivita echinoideorum]